MPRYNNGGKIGAVNTRILTTGTKGIWGVDELKRGPPGPPDPSFASVVLLCRFQPGDWIQAGLTVNSGPALRDYSGRNNHVIPQCSTGTVSNPASGLTTFASQMGFTHSGTASCNGGANGWASNIAVSDFTFGTGDFTMEFWLYFASAIANANFYDQRNTAGAQLAPTIYIIQSGTATIRYFTNNADRITGATAVTPDAFHFISLSRVAGTTYLHLDGAQQGSAYVDANNYVGASGWFFGGGRIAVTSTPMFIQEARVTKGVGRYGAGSYTVPTQPFPIYGP